MSLRPSYPNAENTSTQAGVPLGARVEGEASAAIQGTIGFAFKDASANVVLPQLDSEGRVRVTSEGASVCLKARGTNAGSASEVTLATITLTNDKVYKGLEWVVSCFRDAIFRIEWGDDVGGTETITEIADMLCGGGDFTDNGRMECQEFTAGSTGTQELRLIAQNLNALSTLRGSISILELAA